MKTRRILMALGIVGVAAMLVGLVWPLVQLGSMDIIGGAGVATWRFLLRTALGGWAAPLAMVGFALVVTALCGLFLPRKLTAGCTVQTTALAFALSAVGAAGLLGGMNWLSIAAFHEQNRYPIRYPANIALSIVSLAAFICLCCGYGFKRAKTPSGWGLALDVLTSILWLLPLLSLGTQLYELL